MPGRESEDSWLVWWSDAEAGAPYYGKMEEVPQDHDSFRSAREEIHEELTCRMREINIDTDVDDIYDEMHDARIDVGNWRADDGPNWSIEVDGVSYNIDYVEGGAY
jgi:hypothetical protein